MRPYCNQTKSMWEAYCYSDEYEEGKNNKTFKKVVEAQLLSQRGVMYDQSGYPKLLNGGVRLVFAALYPLEKGFLYKADHDAVNPDATNDPFEVVSDRRLLLKGFTQYPQATLDKMATNALLTTLAYSLLPLPLPSPLTVSVHFHIFFPR